MNLESGIVAAIVTFIAGVNIYALNKSLPTMRRNKAQEKFRFSFRPGFSALLASYAGAAVVWSSPAFAGRRLAVYLLATAAAGAIGLEAFRIWRSPRRPFNRYQRIVVGASLTGFAFVGGALVMAELVSKGWGVVPIIVSLFAVGLVAEVAKNIWRAAVDYFFL